MRANITWKGEDGGPETNTWGSPSADPDTRVEFKKGEAVKVTDPRIIEKAKGNRFYKVEMLDDDEGDDKKTHSNESGHEAGPEGRVDPSVTGGAATAPKTATQPPSQEPPPQHPAPKPLEPANRPATATSTPPKK